MNKTFVCGAWSPLLSPGMRHERLVAHLEQGTFYLFFFIRRPLDVDILTGANFWSR